MSLGQAFYLMACVTAVAVIALRLTRWNSVPRSRRLTIVLALLVGGVALRHPLMLRNEWINEHTPEAFPLANVPNLMGDLLITAAGGYFCILAAQTWGFGHAGRWIAALFGVDALALITLWLVSDAHRTPSIYIGFLGGTATVYSYLAACTILVANLVVLVSILVARLSTRERWALLPMAVAGLLGTVQSVLRILSMVDRARFGQLRMDVGWPLGVTAIFLYALSGLVGYFMYRKAPDRSPSAAVAKPAAA